MTPEERRELAELEADLQAALAEEARLDAEYAALEAKNASAEVPKTSRTESAWRGARKGATFGFADEAQAGLEATMDYLFGDTSGGMEFGDRYRKYRDRVRAEDDKAQKDNPATFAASEMVGSVLVPSGGGAGLLRTMGRGAKEGLMYGVGASDADLTQGDFKEGLKDAAKGGLTGSAASGIFGGLSAVGRGLSNRRVAQDLVDETGRRMPLHLVDEPVGELYKMAGRAPGARQRLAEMERPFIDEAKDRLSKEMNALDDAKYAFDVSNDAARQAIDDASTSATRKIADGVETAKDRARALPESIARRESAQFRELAAKNALPSHQQARLEGIDLQNNPRAVLEKVVDYWNNEAFNVVKKRDFEWGNNGAKELKSSIRAMMRSDPELQLALGQSQIIGKIRGMNQRLRESVLDEGLVTPEALDEIFNSQIKAINGDALMAMRNWFASSANGSGKNSAGMRAVAQKFDDFIRSQLDAPAKKIFNEDIDGYTKALSFVGAANSLSARKKGGLFDIADYQSVSKQFGASGMSAKLSPLQKESDAAFMRVEEAKSALPGAMEQIRRTASSRGRKVQDGVKARRRELARQMRAGRNALKAARKEGPYADARNAVRELSTKVMPENTSLLSDLLAARTMADVVTSTTPLQASNTGKAVIGANIGRMIGSDLAQDLVAGQTGFQTGLRKTMDNEKLQMIAELMRRGLSREAAIAAVGG